MCYLYVEVLNVDYKDIIYMSNMLKVYDSLFCLYLLVVLNLGRMNEMRDCNLKFGVVTLYYTGVIYLLIDYEMFVYICLLLYFNTHFEQHSCASSGFTKWNIKTLKLSKTLRHIHKRDFLLRNVYVMYALVALCS